jgi:hypothetical protein
MKHFDKRVIRKVSGPKTTPVGKRRRNKITKW